MIQNNKNLLFNSPFSQLRVSSAPRRLDSLILSLLNVFIELHSKGFISFLLIRMDRAR